MKQVKHSRIRIAILGLVALGLAGYAFYSHYTAKSTAPNYSTNNDTAYHRKAAEISPAPVADPTATPPPAAPPPASTPQISTSGLITVTSPANAATITSGTVVTGTAKVSDGKLYWLVKGEKSGQLGSGTFQIAGDTTQVQTFSFPLAFSNQAMVGDSGQLEVYSTNPADGSAINQVNVAVGF